MAMDKNQVKFIVGKNPVKEQLKSIQQGELILQKNLKKEKVQDIVKKADYKNLKISYLSKAALDQKFPGQNHQGIVLRIDQAYSFVLPEKDFLTQLNSLPDQKWLVVLLDGIKDPGNLGAVLRSCLLFDARFVILPKDQSASINETVLKRSAGAAMHLKIVYVTNLVRVMNKMKEQGFWIYAACQTGQPLHRTQFDEKKTALVMGEEGRGIRELVRKNCDFEVTIPNNQKIDSFNVSVSTGIILYQIYIQKNHSIN